MVMSSSRSPNVALQPFIRLCPGWETFPRVPVAWLELLSAFVALHLYARRYPNHMLVLYSDNSNVVAWLGTRRSPNPSCAPWSPQSNALNINIR